MKNFHNWVQAILSFMFSIVPLAMASDDCDYVGRHNRLDLRPIGMVLERSRGGIDALYLNYINSGTQPIESQRSFTVNLAGKKYYANYNAFTVYPGQQGFILIASNRDQTFEDCQRIRIVLDPDKNEQSGCRSFSNDSLMAAVEYRENMFHGNNHCDIIRRPRPGRFPTPQGIHMDSVIEPVPE